MKHLRSLIILICLINGIFSQNNYFCDLRCNFNNAPCYREPCPPSYACGSNFSILQLSDDDRENILQLNNNFRHALSEGIYHQLQPASNLYRLSYDMELEFAAQCWANNCRVLHDVCITTDRFEYVAQNVAKFLVTWNVKVHDVIVKAYIGHWLPEIAKLTYNGVKENILIRLRSTRPVLNIMCAKTTHVGCAAVKFGNNFINALVVCNYGPDYCTNDEVLYVDGETDTNCKYGVHEYGLCMPPPKERMRRYWVPPFNIATATSSPKVWLEYLSAFPLGFVLFKI